MNDCENTVHIDLGVTNKFLQAGKFTNAESSNNKRWLYPWTEFDVSVRKSKSSLSQRGASILGSIWTNSAPSKSFGSIRASWPQWSLPLIWNGEVKSAFCIILTAGTVHWTMRPCLFYSQWNHLGAGLWEVRQVTFPSGGTASASILGKVFIVEHTDTNSAPLQWPKSLEHFGATVWL